MDHDDGDEGAEGEITQEGGCNGVEGVLQVSEGQVQRLGKTGDGLVAGPTVVDIFEVVVELKFLEIVLLLHGVEEDEDGPGNAEQQ